MTAAEVNKLGDPFATLLLAKGKFPRSGDAVIKDLMAAVPKDHSLKTRKSFLLGEGSQLPATANVDRSIRLLVTLGSGASGPDVFMSVFDPAQAGGVEVMAWDKTAGGFNFYRSTGEGGLWMLAGNSRDALREASRGKGPFESHPSGSLLMKELKTPWINWDSPAANIPETAFARNDPRRNHVFFTKREPLGAITFEVDARAAMTRWARLRFSNLRKNGGTVTRPRQIMEQILETPTVNLTTTHIASKGLLATDELDLPTTFFVDSDNLSSNLGFEFPPPFTVTGKIYAKCLEKFDVRMDNGQGFRVKGDTHFCFLVPERAFEDQEVLREAIEIGLLSKRLAACLLMVDPWNPIFSDRRKALMRHVPATATIANGTSTFSVEMANAILAAADAGPEGTAEAQFAKRWRVGTDFRPAFEKILGAYYAAVTAQLATQAGFESYFKLAEDRRRTFKDTMRIAEFDLLLPRTNIVPAGRRMKNDATVGEG